MIVLKHLRFLSFSRSLLPLLNTQCTNNLHVSRSLSSENYNSGLTLDDSILEKVVLKSSDNSKVDGLVQNLSAEEAQKLKVLKLEFDVFYSTGVRVPEVMDVDNWVYVLENCPTPQSRKRYYSYLFNNEKARLNRKMKAAENERIAQEKKIQLQEQMDAGLIETFMNTFLLKLNSATVNKHHNNNLCYAMLNGPHLLFDASYDDEMSHIELKALIKQLQVSHGINKEAPYPFHFHFCNLKRSGKLFSLLQSNMDPEKLIMTYSEESYTSLYPKERLVYLSPNAPRTLKRFSFDDVYIIGCFVDKAAELPLSLARAKQDDIRTYKLPLDQNIKWVSGSKALTLNHVVDVLLAVKSNMSWYDAFVKCLPKRKIFDYENERYVEIKTDNTKEQFKFKQ